jgi:CHASE3 domain sensor protein
MRHLRKVISVLLRFAVILAVLMVGLFFTAAAITRANFFSEQPTQDAPGVHATAN